MKKYSWSFDEDAEVWSGDTYDTIQECIEAAKESSDWRHFAVGDRYEHVYIGKNIEFTPTVNAEAVLDALQEQACDQLGSLGHDWDAYDWKKKHELDELHEKLTQVVNEWLDKYGYVPNMYSIEDIEAYSLAQPKEP